MAAKKKEDDEKVHVCKWCGAEYSTRQGLGYHMKVCEYRPTDDDEGPEVPGAGINIFPDDEGVPGAVQTPGEDLPEYECPDCGHCEGAPYQICPVCGAVLSW